MSSVFSIAVASVIWVYADSRPASAPEARCEICAAAKSDREIKRRIEKRLFWSPLVDDDYVRVGVTQRVAVLSGRVEGWDSYGAAIEKAFEGGAEVVRVRLTVPGFAFKDLREGAHEAWLDTEPRARRGRGADDKKLQKQIERQLFWSPFVDRNRIRVRVHDGVAVLTGNVDDWSSHGGATENAFEGGAVSVINLLQVDAPR